MKLRVSKCRDSGRETLLLYDLIIQVSASLMLQSEHHLYLALQQGNIITIFPLGPTIDRQQFPSNALVQSHNTPTQTPKPAPSDTQPPI